MDETNFQPKKKKSLGIILAGIGVLMVAVTLLVGEVDLTDIISSTVLIMAGGILWLSN